MKKLLVITAALALFASPALAVIFNGPHDLSGLGIGTDETCVFCHTPHGANTTTGTAIPLSNRTATGSAFCMSCHDGNVQYSDMSNPSNADVAAGADYNWNTPATAFGAVYAASNHPVSVPMTFGGNFTASNTLGVIDGGNIECTSCHSLHSFVQEDALLRMDNTASDLCTECHVK